MCTWNHPDLKHTMKYQFLSIIIIILFVSSCDEITPPEPRKYPGYDQIEFTELEPPKVHCLYPKKHAIYRDSLTFHRSLCGEHLNPVNFSENSVLVYYDDVYKDITKMNRKAYVLINHNKNDVIVEIANRAKYNTSGMSSNGYDYRPVHFILAPRIPNHYTVQFKKN